MKKCLKFGMLKHCIKILKITGLTKQISDNERQLGMQVSSFYSIVITIFMKFETPKQI